MDLPALQKKVDGNPRSKVALRSLLHHIRTNKLRCPCVVAKHGATLIKLHASSLGDERWTIYEQIFLAAIDINDTQLSNHCLKELDRKFPGSFRVKRLSGINKESTGEFEAASAVYEEILKENPANSLVLKRQISILKAQGETNQAIAKLNKFLQTYQADMSAWSEMAELQLSVSNYKNAAFCFEELILSDPMSYLLHCRLAECLYTIGGSANYLAARKYFSQSLHLKKTNPRALFGLAMCATAISQTKAGKADPAVNAAIHEFACERLEQEYTKVSSTVTPLVKAVLASQMKA